MGKSSREVSRHYFIIAAALFCWRMYLNIETNYATEQRWIDLIFAFFVKSSKESVSKSIKLGSSEWSE